MGKETEYNSSMNAGLDREVGPKSKNSSTLRESALRKFNVNQNEATRSSPEDLYSLFIVALVNAKDDVNFLA